MRQSQHNWVTRSTPLLAAATLALIPLTACSDSSSGGGDKTAPTVSAAPGTQQFGAAFQVTLTALDNKDPAPLIFYTTDLSTPDALSTPYAGPIDVTATTVLKFVAIDAAGNVSDVGVEGYTFVDPALGAIAQQWADSGHGDILGEAFRHWDEDGEVQVNCAKCHAGDGFIDYAEDGVVDLPAALPLGHYCGSCHAAPPATLYDDLATYPALEPVAFPSGATASLWGDSNMCIVCHSGRESKVSVDNKIAATPGGPHSFTNVHYYAAAASLFGTETQGGYEYDTEDYAGRNTFGSHEVTEQTCVGCHMRLDAGAADHTWEPDLTRCNACHAGASFETLAGSPSANYDAIEAAKPELYAEIQDYAATVVGTAITYNPAQYPYWFKPDGTSYNIFDDALLKAAYNYQVAQKDPAGFIHNGTYLRQLLHDSIVDLGGTPTDIAPGRTGFTPSAGEAGKTEEWHLSGHANSAGEAFRHWDDDGEVSASCAKCHSSPGFVEYAQTAAVAAAVPLGSLVDCKACHVDTDLYTDPSTRYADIGNHPALDPVAFPSGATATLGNDSNMCMTCHQGRSSGVALATPNANTVVQVPTDYTSYNFINRHYFAAAAILFGADVTAGFEYAGATGPYKGQNTYSPAHASLDTCFECHMRGANMDHTWLPQLTDCSGCHQGITNFEELGLPFGGANVDYDGDGAGESFQAEIDGMAELLYAAIQTYANGSLGGVSHTSLIVYGPGAYPYWFEDANSNGVYDEGIDVDRFEDFDLDLLRAAFNYHSAQDPCNDMHNYKYALQGLYDSIDFLDDGALNGSTAGTSVAATRP